MQILLTNDDGIHAPGIRAVHSALQQLGDVCVVAPAEEQSGVGHAITFLRPLVPQKTFVDGAFFGWAVNGTPADCVKLGVAELCPSPPDVIISGINGGLNAGINVLYSGTVSAAMEGAFFRIPSFALSLEFDAQPRFETAAHLATNIVRQIMDAGCDEQPQLYNINIPTAATTNEAKPQIHIVPMGLGRYGQNYVKRKDPKNRTYYWTSSDPPPPDTEHATDLNMLLAGHVTVTPLHFSLTNAERMRQMQHWKLKI